MRTKKKRRSTKGQQLKAPALPRKVPAKGSGAGRPFTDFTPAVIARIKDMAGRGMHEYQISACLGISQETFIQHKKLNPEIVGALQAGLSEGIDKVTKGFMLNATADLSLFGQPGGHVGAQKFYLERKAGWKNESEIKVSGEIKTVIKVEIPTIERRQVIDA